MIKTLKMYKSSFVKPLEFLYQKEALFLAFIFRFNLEES